MTDGFEPPVTEADILSTGCTKKIRLLNYAITLLGIRVQDLEL